MEARSIAVLLALSCALPIQAQGGRAPRKQPGKPECARGAICFSGQVSEGEEFRKRINGDLEFVLEPGWTIRIVPTRPEGECTELAWVVNAPFRAHNALYIDMSYGVTAEDEVSGSPREFRFVTNCADYRVEDERVAVVLGPYTSSQEKYDAALAKLGSSPVGVGRMWITDSKVSHEEDTAEYKLGKIEWMKFSVEIRLPPKRR